MYTLYGCVCAGRNCWLNTSCTHPNLKTEDLASPQSWKVLVTLKFQQVPVYCDKTLGSQGRTEVIFED